MELRDCFALLAMTIFIFASCGGGSNSADSDNSTCTGPCGVVQLVVKGSQSFNPNEEHGRITKYRVTVSGDGIEQPVIAEFDGGETEGVVEGIPVGDKRLVSVQAVNPNDLVIREGEENDVSIEGGSTARVEVTLESVPIFTNIADGGVIDNMRLVFQIFSDPLGKVVVEDATADVSLALADVSTQTSQIGLDVATGFGKLSPPLQPAGEHKYTVRNVDNGRYSTVSVNLVDGTKRKGAPFFAAGDRAQPSSKRRLSCGTH